MQEDNDMEEWMNTWQEMAGEGDVVELREKFASEQWGRRINDMVAVGVMVAAIVSVLWALSVAASYVGPGAMREDLEQDIALAVVKAAPGFRGEAAMGTYIYRIAQNCGIDFLKIRKVEVVEFKEERHQVARPNPEQQVLSDEKSERLAAAIRTLPLAIRQPLVLRLEGLSYQEIADITELTISNVGVRIHRATQALKVELGNVASGR